MDGTIIVTPVAQEELAAEVCERLGRDLTDEERVAYGIKGHIAHLPVR